MKRTPPHEEKPPQIDIFQLLEDAKNNPELKGQLDINEILRKHTEKEGGETNPTIGWMQGKTINSLQHDIFNEINGMENIEKDKKKHICEKLIGYRYISQISEFRTGRYVKAVKKDNGKYICGGHLLSVQFTDNGIYITCGFPQKFVHKLQFDEYLIFQKITDDEHIILLLLEQHS